MASNFRIFIHRNNGNLQVKLMGDFDGSSAFELINVLQEHSGKAGKMLCDYNAIELTVYVGEILTVHKAESDFYWVTDQEGVQGWVPIAHVESCENESEAQ